MGVGLRISYSQFGFVRFSHHAHHFFLSPKMNSKRMAKQITTEDFIKKAKKTHGDTYDYSKTEYHKCDSNVIIICKQHGEFLQTPSKHLIGHGCPLCGSLKQSENSKTKKEQFLSRLSNELRSFDYSLVPDKFRQKDKLTIICHKHGLFKSTADNLLHGHGCAKCAKDSLHNKFSWTTEQFIDAATKTHGGKYDYSKSSYYNSGTKVEIICPQHGSFWQSPEGHLAGQGCPSCYSSKLEIEVKELLEINNIKYIYRCSKGHLPWIGRQELDFYLPEYNIGIECQGIQHYRPISFFGGQTGLNTVQQRDIKKEQLCAENNVKLLYFTHCNGIKEEGNTHTTAQSLLNSIYS